MFIFKKAKTKLGGKSCTLGGKQFVFRKARTPDQTLNDLDAYISGLGDEPVKWLAREVRSWGEFSYAEIESAIADGRLNELIDWQRRYAEVINNKLAPMWTTAMAAAALKATKGKVILSDSDTDVKDWIRTHGGELISRLSDESKRAIAEIILRAQSTNLFSPREIAQQIRPLIGLTTQQANANFNYRQRIYQRYIDNGASQSVASRNADQAARRYASSQHRYRAETITHTELAFAYNRGSNIGVQRAIRQGLMGRCAMIWSTAGTNRVCSRCLALKDTVVGYTDESGVTLPPLHPRCRCTIIYDEIGTPQAEQQPQKPGRNYDSEFAKAIGRDHYDKVRDVVENSPHKKAAQVWSMYEDKIKVEFLKGDRAYQREGKIYFNLSSVAAGDVINKPYQLIFHEGGHLIDYIKRIGSAYLSEEHNGGAFLKAINADFKKLLATAKSGIETLAKEKVAIGELSWLYDQELITYNELIRKQIPQKFKISNDIAYRRLRDTWKAKYSLIDGAALSDFLSGATKGTYSLGAGHHSSYWTRSTRSLEAFAEFMETAIANQAAYEILCEHFPTTAKVFEEILDELLKGV